MIKISRSGNKRFLRNNSVQGFVPNLPSEDPRQDSVRIERIVIRIDTDKNEHV
jgi:hypothetical protein